LISLLIVVVGSGVVVAGVMPITLIMQKWTSELVTFSDETSKLSTYLIDELVLGGPVKLIVGTKEVTGKDSEGFFTKT
jgi:hypothetical protein